VQSISRRLERLKRGWVSKGSGRRGPLSVGQRLFWLVQKERETQFLLHWRSSEEKKKEGGGNFTPFIYIIGTWDLKRKRPISSLAWREETPFFLGREKRGEGSWPAGRGNRKLFKNEKGKDALAL